MDFKKRLFLIDPLVSSFEGHFFELATVICKASKTQGFEPYLLANKQLPLIADHPQGLAIQRIFSHRKTHKWSLSPEGRSVVSRDLLGRPNGPRITGKARQFITDRVHGIAPWKILQQTSNELLTELKRLNACSEDALLFTTCDDFTLLAIANALTTFEHACPLNLSFLWHTPFKKGREAEFDGGWSIIPELKCQIEACIGSLQHHNLAFFSTTSEIKDILNAATDTESWEAIDYPIRSDFKPVDTKNFSRPHRILLGGAQRPEKGGRQLPLAVSTLWSEFLGTGRWNVTLQAPKEDASQLVPKNWVSDPGGNVGAGIGPITAAPMKLPPADYLKLIKDADVGLFLYRSRKYYARCSGVLVEMLACGIPVVVPAGSWLSRQIAPFVYKHLDALSLESRMSAIRQIDYNRSLPAMPCIAAEQCFDLPQDVAMLVTPVVSNATHASYIGVEIETAFEHGMASSKETRVLELGAEFTTRFLLRGRPNRKAVKLKFFLPYGKQRLTLQSVQVSMSSAGHYDMPTGAVGIVYNGIDDLPRCFSELDSCLNHYSATAIKNAAVWKEKHSGDRFLACILQRHQESRTRVAMAGVDGL